MTPVVPELPPEIPRDGNAFTAWIGQTVLRLIRWRVVGTPPPLSKLVIIAGPHTSAWDVVIAFIAKLALGIDVSFLAKHTLFFWPLGPLLRSFGCLPVDRTGPHRVVDQMAERFASRTGFLLVLSPEGTRRRVDQWKTGFYYIAQGAGVPIVPAALDFDQRWVHFGPPTYPAGDSEAEIAELRNFIEAAHARHPELV